MQKYRHIVLLEVYVLTDSDNFLLEELGPNFSLNRWMISPIQETPVIWPKTCRPPEIDTSTWLTKGSQQFDHPERILWIKNSLNQVTDPPTPTAKWTLSQPWGADSVGVDGFWATPTALAGAASTTIWLDGETRAKWALAAAGGAILWIDGKRALVVCQGTRNHLYSVSEEITLASGPHQLSLWWTDIAERDTSFRFQVRCQAPSVRHGVPLKAPLASSLKAWEKTMKESYFADLHVRAGGVIKLMWRNPTSHDIPVLITYQVEWDEPQSLQCVLAAHAEELILGPVEHFPSGLLTWRFHITLSGVALSMTRILECYPFAWPAPSLSRPSERRPYLLQLIAQNGVKRSHRAYAALYQGDTSQEVIEWVLAELDRIDRREDCSDFYLLPLLRLWHDFRDKNIWPDTLWNRLQHTILHFRYWVDEPGNDAMWFYSENHALLFHVAEYLAGQYFPDAEFAAAHHIGQIHQKKARARLHGWFDTFFSQGLSEWQSLPYWPIVLQGLLDLWDLADDQPLHEKAKSALDHIMQLMAFSQYRGLFGATQGRAYEKDNQAIYCNALTAMTWLYWGIGTPNASHLGLLSAVLSSYEPPAQCDDWAHSQRPLVLRNTAGPDSWATLYTYRCPGGLLASAVNFRSGEPGYSEQVVGALLTEDAPILINHAGQWERFGSGRPGYFSGNGVLPTVGQQQGLAALLYQIPATHPVPWVHAYFPVHAFDQVETYGAWWFAAVGQSYIALYAPHGALTHRGPDAARELVVTGRSQTWLMRLGYRGEFSSFTAFIESIRVAKLHDTKGVYVHFVDPILGPFDLAYRQAPRVDTPFPGSSGPMPFGEIHWCDNEGRFNN